MEIKNDGFYLNGKPFKLYSGAMHYFRVLPEYWEDRFAKMKAAGFNAVETVMCWNLHEPVEGVFDFNGILDIVRYCTSAAKYGLYVIIRPGPYTCAEWDFGGFPPWLLKDKNLRLRCDNPIFMSKVERYFKKICSLLSPLQYPNGNLIAMQIENEYGSYGNDKIYLEKIEKLYRENNITLPLFTSDGNCKQMIEGGTLPHIYKTLNFGSHANSAFKFLETVQPNKPKTCMEFWCGWFDHWGEFHHKRNSDSVSKEIEKILNLGANINIYMFHGGTNFNFWAGANYGRRYQPVVTSYDDAALLNEYGDYTDAYYKVRKVLLKAQGSNIDYNLPARPKLQNIGMVKLTERGDLWTNLYKLGKKHCNSTPESMEFFGQNYGQILYTTTVKGKYGAQYLYVEGVHDIAYLRINGRLVKKYDRANNRTKRYNDGFKAFIPASDGELKIEILVEGMGRVNYGHEMERDRKGLEKVRLSYQTLFNWDIYTLPFDNIDKAIYDNANKGKPSILRGYFDAKDNEDCFVDMKGFKKGFVIVNGFNLGRYWNKGPQRSLYLPYAILKDKNEIIVVEQEGYRNPTVSITDKHYL